MVRGLELLSYQWRKALALVQVPCLAMLYHAMPCYALPFYSLLFPAMHCFAKPCYSLLCPALPCRWRKAWQSLGCCGWSVMGSKRSGMPCNRGNCNTLHCLVSHCIVFLCFLLHCIVVPCHPSHCNAIGKRQLAPTFHCHARAGAVLLVFMNEMPHYF